MSHGPLVLGFLALSLAAVSASVSVAETTRSARSALVGATPSDQKNVLYVRAGVDVAGTESRACTGTLVAEDLVLTARHCVSYFQEGDFSCTIDGDLDETRQRSPANAGEVGLPYAARHIQLFFSPEPPVNADQPDLHVVRVFAPETDTICRNDIALIQVELSPQAKERGFELSAFTPAALRLSTGVALNEPVRLVGYGTNDHGTDRQEELAETPIIAVGPSEFFPTSGLSMPRTFVVGRGPCPGDSGGPAFSVDTGALLGVYSIFRGRCESAEARNFYTQVAPFRSFIEDVFEAVGRSALPEAAGGGGASSSSGGSDGGDPLGGEGGMTREPPGQGGCSVVPGRGRLYGWPPFVTILGMSWFWVRRRQGSMNVERS